MSDSSIRRVGKEFFCGAPYLTSRGISFNWPEKDIQSYRRAFTSRRGDLGLTLLQRCRENIVHYPTNTSSPYPRLQSGMHFEIVHIGSGGRWIEFGPDIGGSSCSFHNIDSLHERIMGFNLAADALEFLDESILSPRIEGSSGTYVPSYPLPQGLDALPLTNNSILTRPRLENFLKQFSLGNLLGLSVEKDSQEIKTERGVITIQQGFCKASGFENGYIPNSTCLAAKCLDSCFLFS